MVFLRVKTGGVRHIGPGDGQDDLFPGFQVGGDSHRRAADQVTGQYVAATGCLIVIKPIGRPGEKRGTFREIYVQLRIIDSLAAP